MDPVTISIIFKIISVIIGGIAIAFSAYYIMRQLRVYNAYTQGVIDYDFTIPSELRFGSRLIIEGHMYLDFPSVGYPLVKPQERIYPSDLDVNISLGTSPFKLHVKQFEPGKFSMQDWIYSAPGQEQVTVSMTGTFIVEPGVSPVIVSRGLTKTLMIRAPEMSIDVGFEPSRLTAGKSITCKGKATFAGVTRENIAPGITPFAEIQTPWKVYQDIPIAEDGTFSFNFVAPFPGSYVITVTANLYSSFAYVPPGWIRIYVVVPKTFTIVVESTTGAIAFNPEDPLCGLEDVAIKGSTSPTIGIGIEVNGTERFEATTDASGNFAGIINREYLKRGANDVRVRAKKTGEIILASSFVGYDLYIEFEMPVELYYTGSEVAGSVQARRDSEAVEFFAQCYVDGVLAGEGSAKDGIMIFYDRVEVAPEYPAKADYIMRIVFKYRAVRIDRTSAFQVTRRKA